MRTEFTWKALLSATYWTNSTFGGGCPAGNDITYILSVAATIVFVAICSALVITSLVIFRKLRWL